MGPHARWRASTLLLLAAAGRAGALPASAQVTTAWMTGDVAQAQAAPPLTPCLAVFGAVATSRRRTSGPIAACRGGAHKVQETTTNAARRPGGAETVLGTCLIFAAERLIWAVSAYFKAQIPSAPAGVRVCLSVHEGWRGAA
jgi:hypothetical protein